MLTSLSTVKSRLQILDTDTSNDALLTSAIKAVSARFGHETRRTLAHTVDATHEFDPSDTELLVPCYPIESVTRFELKTSEAEGWLEQSNVQYLIRHSCVISLAFPLNLQPTTLNLARVLYTGGYVLPGTTPAPGQTPLPDDLEHAAIEQVAFWFQKRDKLGIRTNWPSSGTYQLFSELDLLTPVRTILAHYARWTL